MRKGILVGIGFLICALITTASALTDTTLIATIPDETLNDRLHTTSHHFNCNVNCDGRDDVMAGVWGNGVGWSNAANMYIRPGDASRNICRNVHTQNCFAYNIELSEAEISSSPTSSGAFIRSEPAGDLNGDGADDMLVGFGSDASRNLLLDRIDAVSGDDGAVHWSVTCDKNRWVYAISAGNLNRDSMGDVLLLTRSYDSGTDAYLLDSMSVLNGENGAVLWSKDINKDQLEIWTKFDFNSDGMDDIMVQHASYKPSIDANCIDKIYILKGDDGSLLWQKNPDNWVDAYPAGDLTGNDAEDLLVYTQQNFTTHWTAEIFAVRGSDGGTLWSKTASNKDSVWLYPADLAGDLNGDGTSDVVMCHERYNPSADDYTTTIYALHGNSGSVIWGDGSTASDSWMDVYPAGDLNGDVMDDVLLYPWKHNPANGQWYVDSVYVKRGYDNHQLWSKTGTAMAFMRASDLNCDGADDLLFRECVYDTSTARYLTTGISAAKGQDGSTLWTKTRSGGNYVYALPAGDLNGDDAEDVLVYNINYGSYDPDLDEIYADVISAVKGSDGSVMWSKSRRGNTWIDIWHAGCTGDLDCDGTDDLLVCTQIYNAVSDRHIPTIISAVRGGDGGVMWNKSALCGDLDLDGMIAAADARVALEIAVGGAHNPAADVNGDGSITSIDALLILEAAAGGGGL